MKELIGALVFLLAAPIVGGLLAGADRIISARMQSRVGPPLFQPFFDVLKLFEKKQTVVTHYQTFYMSLFLLFVIISGMIFFSGGDLLLCIFALTVGGVFLALAAFSPNSPYSKIGAERELLQMMSYEPMLLLVAIGFYGATQSFQIHDIFSSSTPLLWALPGMFVGYLFILTIKLRKSPFDLSTSHHGHQELVKGLTIEFSGRHLALIEIAHWYENVLLLGFVYLFVAQFGVAIAVAITLAAYLLEILIDNTYARLTWHFTLKASWIVAAVFGVVNLILIFYFPQILKVAQ